MVEPISTAAASIGILKQLGAGLKRLRQSNLSDEHKAAVMEQEELLFDLRDRLSSLQDESIQLREENAALRGTLDNRQTFASERAKYHLVKAPGGAMVYGLPSEMKQDANAEYYVCPSCIDTKDQIQFLQDQHSAAGAFKCPGCDAAYPVGPSYKLR